MSGVTWIERYDSLKARFGARRAQGLVFADDEVNFIQENLNSLNLDLKLLVTMPEGPEKPHPSEIARREVLLSNMGMQLRNVKESNSLSTTNALHSHKSDRASSTESVSARVEKMHLFGRSDDIDGESRRQAHVKGYNPVATSEAGLSMRVSPPLSPCHIVVSIDVRCVVLLLSRHVMSRHRRYIARYSTQHPGLESHQ